MSSKQFGGKLTPELINQYSNSPNWKGGEFKNLETTTLNIGIHKIPGILYKNFTTKGKEPSKKLPIVSLDREAFLAPSSDSKYIWYGHAAVLMRMNGKTILIDPMLGPNAAPISPVKVNRFSNDTLDLIDDFPEVDLLLMTHDHYDHLDLFSMERLKKKVKKYFVALGVKRHLVSWGIDPNLITEFDWWDNHNLDDISITFTPTRHFSGRGIKDRAKSLWGGWVFKTDKENIWFSGDGGYGQHFKDIGLRLGPFDFAFMECGQYNENWNLIHMFPEECVQAAIDAGAKKAMPFHWAGFALAPHAWTDPAERFHTAAVNNELPFTLPTLGQLHNFSDTEVDKWWEF